VFYKNKGNAKNFHLGRPITALVHRAKGVILAIEKFQCAVRAELPKGGVQVVMEVQALSGGPGCARIALRQPVYLFRNE